MSSLLEIESAYNYTKRVSTILKFAKRSQADLEKVRCSVLYGKIIILKRHRCVIIKLLKKSCVKEKLAGEELNN